MKDKDMELFEKSAATIDKWICIHVDILYNNNLWSLKEFKKLIIDTYNLFLPYCDEDYLPKEIINILIHMNQFMCGTEYSVEADDIYQLTAYQLITKRLLTSIIQFSEQDLYKEGKIYIGFSNDEIILELKNLCIDDINLIIEKQKIDEEYLESMDEPYDEDN